MAPVICCVHRVVGGALALALLVPAAGSAAERLPDLAMAPLQDFKVDRTADGRKLLRYTAIVVNIGEGSFRVSGSRSSASESEMTVLQQIDDDTQAVRAVATPARMYFAGDGHTHWHVRDLEESVLERLDNGVKVGSGAKHGFCFYDNVAFRLSLPGAPASPGYTTCGRDPSVLTQDMGLSIGWGDAYSYQLVDQWVDITAVGAGHYRLRTTADAQNWFVEFNEFNNVTWVDLQLKTKGPPRVTRYGPSA
jgi:hypothetical protein